MEIKFIEASGKSCCRGGDNCQYLGRRNPMPKGMKILMVSVYGAGGGATAYYCNRCLTKVLEACKEVIAEADV